MLKLLLVEDDNNLREIYEARLQAEGYAIVSAKDGEEALVIAKAEKPDLIISDVMMPKISGFEMLDILRNTEELKNVKIIMLTALGQSDDQQRADRLGADRYLVKSQVTLEDIVKVAHELLQDETAAPADATPIAAPTASPDTSTAPAPTPPAPAVPAPEPEPVAVEPAMPAPVPAPEPISEPTPKSIPVTVSSPEVAVAPEPSQVSAAPTDTPAASTVETAAPPAEPPTAPTLPEPVPTPAPEPTTPPASISSATASTDSVAQSTAQEEADIEAKIEDFVAGASSEPTRPETVGSPTPATSAPAAATDSPADDVLITGAVQGSTDTADTSVPGAPPPPEAPTATPAFAPTLPALQTVAPEPTVTPAPATPPPAPEPAPTPTPASSATTPAPSSKKVIKPLDAAPKKDIKTLLAMEEIAQKSTQGAPVPVAVVATDETGPQTVPVSIPQNTSPTTPAAEVDDPNNIAL